MRTEAASTEGMTVRANLDRWRGPAFFVSGAVVSASCVWLQVDWSIVANDWLGLGVSYDSRPRWFAVLMACAAWLPWLLLAACVALWTVRRASWRPLPLAAGILVPWVYVFAALFLMPPLESYRHRRAFDARLWMAHEAADPDWPDRLCMVDDLIASGTLHGRSRTEILQLLGPADDGRGWPGWDLIYWLGPERGTIRIDSELLAIRFAPDGRVSAYRIVRD